MLFGANSLLASTFVLLFCCFVQVTLDHVVVVTCQEQEHPQQHQHESTSPTTDDDEHLFVRLSAAAATINEDNTTAMLFNSSSAMPNEDFHDCSRQQQQQQQQSLNLTDVIHRKFVYLFNSSSYHEASFQVPNNQFQPPNNLQQRCHPQQANNYSLALNETAIFVLPSNILEETTSANITLQDKKNDHNHQAQLETRTTNQQASSTATNHSIDDPLVVLAQQQQQSPPPTRRNYFRVLNRVFSRVELPDVFRRPSIRTLVSQQQPSSSSSASSNSGGALGSANPNSLCALHIGCIDELPNFPSLLKLRPNVSATFTVYSRDNPKLGHRIQYEPLMHYQLQDADVNEVKLKSEIQAKIQQQQEQQEKQRQQQQQQHHHHQPVSPINQLIAQPLNSLRLGGGGGGDHHHHLIRPANPIQTLANTIGGHSHRRSGGGPGGAVGVLSAIAAGAKPPSSQSLLNKRLLQQHQLQQQQRLRQQQQQQSLLNPQANNKKLVTTANNWLSATKVAHSLELPFDLSALERSQFNSSLTTRVIIGGYFAKEDEEWVNELIKAWLQLEPCNVIKVSWQDSNRGLYHTAAYNSRIVGRQLSLFLHYMNELFHLDLNKFHLVGHSLGAHIAGFVGSDLNSQIARITGLDPAGPIFVDLSASHRLDPSDAKFVDVLHTNGGTITKGALGLSIPSGHVDFYCNGGSLQPGCYFSSVTRSIMDPVERVACNHRRSYRYFTEIIKLAASANNRQQAINATNNIEQFGATSGGGGGSNRFPEAFLFHAKQEDLVRLVQPELSILAQEKHSSGNPRKSRKISSRFDSTASSIEQYVAQYFTTPTVASNLNQNNNNNFYSSNFAPDDNEDGSALGANQSFLDMNPPLKWQIEFHSLNPRFPLSRRGQYFFRTRSEAPFFSSRQFAITIRSDQLIKRRIALLAKINNSQVAEIELDELDGSFSFVFVPNDPKLLDFDGISRGLVVPDLWLMWRHRSFNLLLGQQNEIQLSSVELNLLDNYPTSNLDSYQLVGENDLVDELINATTATIFDENQTPPSRSRSSSGQELNIDLGDGGTTSTNHQPIRVVEYKPTTTQTNSHPMNNRNSQDSSSSSSLMRQNNLSINSHFSLFRNQWHKFEGKPILTN